MKLVIVESPTKAKTIQKYLGADVKVIASGGHVRDLPEKTFGIDVEHNFKPEYVMVDEKKETVKKLKQAAKDAEVYLATDPDREGEAISWHLSAVLDLGEKAKRIEFHEITQRAVTAAMKSPREINMNLVDAQQARRILDRIVGYKVSPILNQKIKSGLSGGRVQSAGLKLIVDREREILAFVPEEFWTITALLGKLKGDKDPSLKAQLYQLNGKTLKVTNKEQADVLLPKLKAAPYTVASVKRGVSKSRPNAPFTTSTMQQDASSRLSMSAAEVMRLAQQLYEGIEIEGEGHTALVTYIRTDSVRVAPEAQSEALAYIKATYGKEYAPEKPNFYASKSGSNVQDAHEAIRPITIERTPESVKNLIDKNQYRLYKLIYERFLASQMTEAEYNTLNIVINADVAKDEVYGFKISGKTLLFKGYTAAYEIEKDEEEDEDGDRLPNVDEGEALSCKDVKGEQKFTKPPARYTDATFIKAMEDNGIGRPATYATVVSTLSKREYTEKEGKNIKPTQLGFTVTEFMEKNFPDIVDIEFTAKMESELDEVVNGTEWQKIIGDFYPTFVKEINAAKGEKKVMAEEVEVSDVKCDKCGAMMVVRNGRFGKFLACPNFPKCKNVKSIVKVTGKCPQCGGDVVEKRTKTGKTFYGCSSYPNCQFMSWEPPAPYLCPDCNSVMRIVKKNDKTSYICTSKACNKVIEVNE